MKSTFLLSLVFCVCAVGYCGIPDAVGYWQFNGDPNDTDPNLVLAAEIGNDLVLVGDHDYVDGMGVDDRYAVSIGVGSHFRCMHGIAPNGGGIMVNEWTLLVDFSFPESSVGSFIDFFQTNSANETDSDWTIHSSDQAIGIADVGYSRDVGFFALHSTWYRMVISVDNDSSFDVYIDGALIFHGNVQAIDGRFGLEDVLLLFAANDGDDNEIYVSTVAIWDQPLTSGQIGVTGGPGDPVLSLNTPPVVDAGLAISAELPLEGGVTIDIDATVFDENLLSVEWSKISGPNDITFADRDPLVADTTAEITSPGIYILQLTAEDSEFSVSDIVIVSVLRNGYDNLLVEWKFEETWNGSTVLDTSGNNKHGIVENGAIGVATYGEGKVGNGLELQNGDYTSGGDDIALDMVMPDSGTIAMWYYVNSLYNYQAIFDNSVQADDWEMWIYEDSRLRFRIQDDNPVTANLNSLSSDGSAVDEWFHIAVTWQKTGDTTADTALYVNGVLEEENSGSWVVPGDQFYLGGGNSGNDFGDGIWDEVLIYDRALSLSEIRSLVWKNNQPPIIEAGDDKTLWLPEDGGLTFNMEGSVQDDGGPGELIIDWSVISGPNDLSFVDSTQPDTEVTLLYPGTYHLAIDANDGQFGVSDDVTFTVYPFGYTGLTAHLTFDDDSVTDSSGEGNDGTYVDGTNGTSAYVPGKVGKALDLQNSHVNTDGDYISFDYVMTDSGTISMWYKVSPLYNYQSVFDNSAQQDDWEMWIYNDSRLRFRIQSDNPVTADLNSLAGGNCVGKWFHIVAMWQKTGELSADTALFVNGTFIGQSSGSWVVPGDTFYLGGGHDGNMYSDGIMDDVRIYERILTVEEIVSLASLSDFDNDLDVDVNDFASLADQWLSGIEGCDSTPLGDYNVDCQINLEDLAEFAQYFLLGVD